MRFVDGSQWQSLCRLTGPWLRGLGSALFAVALLLVSKDVAAQEETSSSTLAAEDDSEAIAFFEDQVRPLLVAQCYECHSQEAGTAEGGLRLDSRAGWEQGGDLGAAIVPGKKDESWLIRAVRPYDDALQMPPDGRLTDAQIAVLERWVESGAIDPRTSESAGTKPRPFDLEAGRAFWSMQPIDEGVREALDQLGVGIDQSSPYRAENRIDWAIQSQWQARGIEPVPRAQADDLIRRISLDLTGLPPTIDEVRAFVQDARPDAVHRTIDRLLASPAYGERWGRHWLDIARYADSNGMDENIAHGNAWRYRDWVVRAWNQDLPYDQFLQWQIAGDLLPASDDEATQVDRIIATGFLSLGPKVLAEVDETKMELDIVDEQVETVGRAFLGMTFGCARCHDHKFDPIRTDDYYALAGIFKSTKTMEHFRKIAKWHERTIETRAEKLERESLEQSLAEVNRLITELVAEGDGVLQAELGEGVALPEDKETRYSETSRTRLAELRQQAQQLTTQVKPAATTMGVEDYPQPIDLPVHIRGSHLTLGEIVPRGIPLVFQPLSTANAAVDNTAVDNTAVDNTAEATGSLVSTRLVSDFAIPAETSGRRELARWMTAPENPLTDRVIVNRIWRWHFGRGLVSTTDNFGVLGDRPTHPELLDELSLRFRDHDRSLKWLHRQLLQSAVYQRASVDHARNREIDPAELTIWRFRARRLEAESLRDAMLAVAEQLDYRMGGSLLHVGNREFLFDHTSKDATRYDTPVRSLYLPVIRNHLFDLFGLFDYNDAAVPLGDRATTIVPNQALFLLNSPLVSQLSQQLASQSLASGALSPEARLTWLFERVLSRSPSDAERARMLAVLSRDGDVMANERGWMMVAQSLLISNEFLYLE